MDLQAENLPGAFGTDTCEKIQEIAKCMPQRSKIVVQIAH